MALPAQLDQALSLAMPHLWPVALCAARLLPICLMCPVLGGPQAPVQVRLSLALLLALFVHLGGAVGLGPSRVELVPAFACQLLVGLGCGYVASLPFHAARVGGRLLDTFRGATSEARLPEDVDKDSATAGLLHPLLVALLCAGPGHSAFLSAIVRSFALVPLSAGSPGMDDLVERCASGALAVMATGLAIGAPVAALSLTLDVGLGLAGRAAPQLRVSDLVPPIKLGLGMAVILLGLGAASGRLLALAAESVETLGGQPHPGR